MNVLQVSKFYHPVSGGIERVVQQLAEGLVEGGHEVGVLAATQRGRGGVDSVNGVSVTRAGCLGVVLSVPIAPTFPGLLSKKVTDGQVVHYHLPNPLAVISHHLVRPKSPTVVTYHSDIVKQSKALRLYRPVLERFLDDVDLIVTTSPRLREQSPILRQFRGKTTVVPLGVDVEFASGTTRPDEAETDAPIVLFVGRLTYYKGVSVLLRAMARVEHGRLVIAGMGDRRDQLESLADSLGIGDRVSFLGHVSDERLADLYRNADVFVLPSVEPSEAFGIVQLEAMANEVPVINTNLPSGVPWVSKDGESGLTVPPNDASALADALSKLLADPELRERMGKRGRKRVEQEFSEQQMISKYLTVYRELIE